MNRQMRRLVQQNGGIERVVTNIVNSNPKLQSNNIIQNMIKEQRSGNSDNVINTARNMFNNYGQNFDDIYNNMN